MSLRDYKANLDFGVYGEMGNRYYDGKRELPYIVVAAQIVVSDIRARLLEATVCRIKGHDWEDTSYGGPNRGYESGHCNRCGWSFHHTMY